MKNLSTPTRGVPNTAQRLLTVREAAAYTKMSTSWLNKQRLAGGFVRHLKIGRRVFYDVADIDAALEQAKRRSTSDV